MTDRLLKFSLLSHQEKKLLFEALLVQLTVCLVIKLLPFRLIVRFFSGKINSIHDRSRKQTDINLLLQIKNSVRSAGDFYKWKNKCLVQSLAARWMLNHRKIHSQLCLGAVFDQTKNILAHAWLIADDFEIVEKNGDYQELFLF